MKRNLLFFLLLLLVASLWSVGCKHHTIIPDDELALIFHDAFLANSYLNDTDAKRDSLLVYEPIFERYGYTTEDVRYTIGNFSKRKSARLGDVVERAITLLEAEGERLNRAVAALDTINHVAVRTSRRPIYRDSLVRVKRLRDTSRLTITLDSLRPGTYYMKTRYEVDSLDENRTLRAQFWLEDTTEQRFSLYTMQLRREKETLLERTFEVDTNHYRLVLSFWNPARGERKRPYITLRDLEIDYTLPIEEAVDSLYKRELPIRIFAHDFLTTLPADSLALPADTTRLAETPAR